MNTIVRPPNERNLNGAVSVIRSISQWPNVAIETINDKLGETVPKFNDLRLIRRVNLENLETDARKTHQFLDMQNKRHEEEIKGYREFIDFCKDDDVYKTILHEFQLYQQRKAAARSASAPPVLPEQSLMKHYRFKY